MLFVSMKFTYYFCGGDVRTARKVTIHHVFIIFLVWLSLKECDSRIDITEISPNDHQFSSLSNDTQQKDCENCSDILFDYDYPPPTPNAQEDNVLQSSEDFYLDLDLDGNHTNNTIQTNTSEIHNNVSITSQRKECFKNATGEKDSINETMTVSNTSVSWITNISNDSILINNNMLNCTVIDGHDANQVNSSDLAVNGKNNSYSGRGSRPQLGNGILSKEQHDEYIQIIKSVKWALNVVALIMTVLAIFSFIRSKTKSSSTTFIIALNTFEAMAAFISIVGYALNWTLSGSSKDYLLFTQSMSLYFTAVVRRIVYMLNFLMSGQRLTVVALPFLARTAFRNKINVIVIVIVTIVISGAHVYIALTYDIQHLGGENYRLSYSSLYGANADFFEMTSNISKFLFAILPLIASLIVNFLLLAFLRRHAKHAEGLRAAPATGPPASRQERQITLMVLVSSLCFTALCLPANTHLLASTYTPDYGYYKKQHYLFLVMHESLLGLLTLGDITNFLCYLFLSTAFRNQLVTATVSLCPEQDFHTCPLPVNLFTQSKPK